MSIRRVGLFVLVFACAACSDDTAPPADSATDADAGGDAADTGLTEVEVMPPALPALTPCPVGWHEVAGSAGAPAYCEPFDSAGHAPCAADEAHYPGTPGCAPVGDPCPADGWPADLPDTNVVYANAAAPTGGDGSREAPFDTLRAAVAAAPDGATLAIAPGRYGPVGQVDRPLSIVGACTDVVLSSTETDPVIENFGTFLTVRNIRISGAREGIWSFAGDVTVERVVIDDLVGTGLNALQTTVVASRLKFDAMLDSAISLAISSRMDADQISTSRVNNDPMRISSTTAVVRDSVFERDDDGAFFFAAQTGGITFERTAFLGPGTILGLNAPSIEMRDCVLVGPPLGVMTEPGAIAMFEGGSLTLERVRIERARSLGIAVADAPGELTISDVVMRDIVGIGDGVGHAIEVGAGARATLDRVFIERAMQIGVLATGIASHISAHDVRVVDTRPNISGTFGRAFQVQSGATLMGSRLHVVGSHEVAMVAGAPDARIEVDNLLVEGTLPRTCDGCLNAGIAVGAYLGGAISLARFRLADNALAGVQLANDGSVDLRDGVVSGNIVGINVQVPGYDVERLTNGVVFRDNETNLDSRELPLPDPTARP